MSIESIKITHTTYGRTIGHAVGKMCIWLGMKPARATWASMQFMVMSIQCNGGKRQWVWLGGSVMEKTIHYVSNPIPRRKMHPVCGIKHRGDRYLDDVTVNRYGVTCPECLKIMGENEDGRR